jgi:transposase
LELLQRGDKSAGQIERELGITPGLLLKWRLAIKSSPSKGKQPKWLLSDLEAAKAEIRRLQRELANLEEEREILKKALSIFSRKSE